jgi:hypothetical protein
LAAEVLLWVGGDHADDISSGPAAAEDIGDRFNSRPSTAAVLTQALDTHPENRFDTVSAFVTALEEALYEDSFLHRDIDPGDIPGAPWDKRRSLASYLNELGFETKDRRATGGALWVIANHDDFARVSSYLARRGVDFQFAPAGGRASGHQPAWYSKDPF